MECGEVGVPMARILTELKPPDDVTGLLLGYLPLPHLRQWAIIVLYKGFGPLFWVESETLVLDLPPENKAGNKPTGKTARV